jgi:3-dehydroquinate synthase
MKLRVKLKNAYDIFFGNAFKLKEVLGGASKVLVIADKNVAKLYLKSVENDFKKQGFNVVSAVINAGEAGKSLSTLASLYDKALKLGLDRKSAAVALGGGVTGDVSGFFASTYMRGIKYVQMPTTLLAMADSSVGGKTAVNLRGGKNIAGTFYQPAGVFVNTAFLKTLSARHIKNGFAEIIKYAFSIDIKFFNYLQKLIDAGHINQNDFAEIVKKSCAYKARVVEKDEHETKGMREILNFGHTLAHAVETYTGYKYLHGEAVIFGMMFAAQLSVAAGLCAKSVADKIKEFLLNAGFEVTPKIKMDANRLLQLMKKDKKNNNGKIKFVLLKGLGRAQCGVFVPDAVVLKALKNYLRGF